MSSTTPLHVSTPPDTIVALPSPLLLEAHQRVAAFTQQIFGNPATVSQEFDPEEGFEFFRVRVQARGTHEEIREQYNRWHRDLPQAAREFSDRYALSPALPE